MAGLLTPATGWDDPADPVTVTVHGWASTPFVWGGDDCGFSVLRHVERVTGQLLADIRPDLVPRYATAIGARRVARRRGGFFAGFGEVMAALGCTKTDEPARGDVGLILIETGLTAALCTGRLQAVPDWQRWAARGDGLVVLRSCGSVTAWRLPCRRP